MRAGQGGRVQEGGSGGGSSKKEGAGKGVWVEALVGRKALGGTFRNSGW